MRSSCRDLAAQVRVAIERGDKGLSMMVDGEMYDVEFTLVPNCGLPEGAGLTDEQFEELTGCNALDEQVAIFDEAWDDLCPRCDAVDA